MPNERGDSNGRNSALNPPAAADYLDAGDERYQEVPELPPLTMTPEFVGLEDALPPWVVAFVEELVKAGLDQLANFIRGQFNQNEETWWISKNAFYASKDDHLLVWVDNVDDEAEVMLNNQVLGNYRFGYGGAWVIVPNLKPGLNALVVKLKNTGQLPSPLPGKWSVRVIIRERSTGKDVPGASYFERGDDQLTAWHRTRMFITRFWGQ